MSADKPKGFHPPFADDWPDKLIVEGNWPDGETWFRDHYLNQPTVGRITQLTDKPAEPEYWVWSDREGGLVPRPGPLDQGPRLPTDDEHSQRGPADAGSATGREKPRARRQTGLPSYPVATQKTDTGQWIATDGADLSGHDFGCEWIWIMWGKERPFWAKGGQQLVAPFWLKMWNDHGHPSWSSVTHYQPTAIRTPEPPQ